MPCCAIVTVARPRSVLGLYYDYEFREDINQADGLSAIHLLCNELMRQAKRLHLEAAKENHSLDPVRFNCVECLPEGRNM
jgi:hypothetical protein